MKTPTYLPSNDQVAALRTFAKVHGRKWKAALNQAWMTGVYEGIEPYGDVAAYLQQVRNNAGPSWLARLTLHDEGGWTIR